MIYILPAAESAREDLLDPHPVSATFLPDNVSPWEFPSGMMFRPSSENPHRRTDEQYCPHCILRLSR
jgi:hypothetical protein